VPMIGSAFVVRDALLKLSEHGWRGTPAFDSFQRTVS
jgi:hypothetical protein